ncbi:myelin regulatory factor [Pelomyxa schiedti]|nr:myelin regulatory factor [Pelomyxa schiedti]
MTASDRGGVVGETLILGDTEGAPVSTTGTYLSDSEAITQLYGFAFGGETQQNAINACLSQQGERAPTQFLTQLHQTPITCCEPQTSSNSFANHLLGAANWPMYAPLVSPGDELTYVEGTGQNQIPTFTTSISVPVPTDSPQNCTPPSIVRSPTLAGKKRSAEEVRTPNSPNSLSWTLLAPSTFVLYDSLCKPTSYDIIIESEGYHFSSEMNSFIHYRRNQLKLSCTFILEDRNSVAQYILNNDKLEQIESLSYCVTAVVADSSPLKKVELHYSTVTRDRQQKSPCVFSCVQGQRCILPKLYFAKATSHNSDNKKQEYFQLIITLTVHTKASTVALLSKISDSLIVRGNHPGKYSPKLKESSDTVKSVPLKLCAEETDLSAPKTTNFVGKVGINTKHPSEALTVMGNIALTGTVHQTSDVRIKENVKLLDTSGQLEKLSQVKLYEYNMKEEVDGTKQTRHGVIAQEVKEIFPNAVVESPFDLKLRNGQQVSKLMFVDKDALLMETLGATVEMAKQVHRMQPRLSFRQKVIMLVVLVIVVFCVMFLTCTLCHVLHQSGR